MDKKRAKEILGTYRPGIPEDMDAETQEALELLKSDPELARWFEEQGLSYHAIRGKLKQIEVPAGLKRKILLANIGRTKVTWLRKPVAALALAAGIVILGAIAWVIMNAKPVDSFPEYRDRMARSVQRGYEMQMVSTNLTEIRAFLKGKHVDADYALTKNLQQVPGKGCAAMYWRGKPVSMICFEEAGKKDMWLFVANRHEIANTPQPGQPVFSPVHRLLTASWSSGDRVYVLAAAGDEAYLKKYLP